uniref:Putative organic cation transporter-9 membrane helices n=1 Tax=Lutzomyia longipalpis TaxID=7200 RepID=A0A1B0CDA4_LUTLO
MDEMECSVSENLVPTMNQEQQKFDLDLLIEQVGPFGKFQLKLFSLLCISSAFATAFAFMFIFTAGEMSYRCRIPGCDGNCVSYQAPFLNFTIPVLKEGFSKCEMFQRTVSNTSLEDHCQWEFFDPEIVESCSEFVYEDGEATILNEWNLGCSEEWKLSLVGTVNNIGQLLCLPLAGYLSDRFGRRTAFIWSVIFTASLGLIRSFSTNFTMFIVFEFLEPALGSGMFNTAFILAIFCSIGLACLGVMFMLIRDWRLLMRILYGAACFMITYQWLLPESPRWLVNKNRITEAAKIIDKTAKINKKSLTLDAQKMLNQMLKGEEKFLEIEQKTLTKKESRLKILLKSPTMIFRFINCSISWIATLFVYTGFNMTSVFISGDKYVNFIVSCLIEIPACAIGAWLMATIGRRKVLCMDFLLFPTELRQSLFSGCSFFGRIGAILAPFTLYLGKYMESMEMILFAAITIPAGILILFAPETLNKPLPDTIQDAENLKNAKSIRYDILSPKHLILS